MSRMIFALVLAAGLVFAVGCGSKPEPTQPIASLASEPTPPTSPNPPTPPTTPTSPVTPLEPTKGAWELDQSKHVIPEAPVKGSIAGMEVTPEAVLEGDELNFIAYKAGTREMERNVKLKLAPMLLAGQPIPSVLGRNWKVKTDAEQGPEVPVAWRFVGGKDPFLYPSGYALTLELGSRKEGAVAGKIYLSLPDDQKTVLVGTFAAKYSRPHTEPPGPDDTPYIGGEVNVVSAKPNAEVRIAYAAFSPAGVSFKELQLSTDANPLELAQWTRDETEKSRLISGDGKSRPFRYEHVKLAPGRYLISAAVVGGPAVWKWVDVTAGSKLTENFTIDATKTGGVEVSAPAGMTGKLLIAPADDPGKPALETEIFRALELQIVRQDIDLVSGKALIKNLAPGKYEVRAGDLKGTVEIVAGKTVEFALMPPKK